MAWLLSQSRDLGAGSSYALIMLHSCHYAGRRDFRCQGPDNVPATCRLQAVAERYGSWRLLPTSAKTGLCDHRRAT